MFLSRCYAYTYNQLPKEYYPYLTLPSEVLWALDCVTPRNNELLTKIEHCISSLERCSFQTWHHNDEERLNVAKEFINKGNVLVVTPHSEPSNILIPAQHPNTFKIFSGHTFSANSHWLFKLTMLPDVVGGIPAMEISSEAIAWFAHQKAQNQEPTQTPVEKEDYASMLKSFSIAPDNARKPVEIIPLPVIPEPKVPVSCDLAWGQIQDNMDKILDHYDPKYRNQQINTAYAELYYKEPDLQWSGLAAFASKQVGCALQFSSDVIEKSWMTPTSIGNSLASVKMETNIARATYDAMAKGNGLVFESVYPGLVFYQKHGYEQLVSCLEGGNIKIADELIDALGMIEAGDLAGGNESIADYEQNTVLQEGLYNDNSDLRIAMTRSQTLYKSVVPRFFGAREIELVFAADCQGGKETPKTQFTGKDFTDEEERWEYVLNILAEFDELVQQHPGYLNEQLGIIMRTGDSYETTQAHNRF